MFGRLSEFFEEHPVLTILGGLWTFSGVKRALTGAGLSGQASTNTTESLVVGETSTLSLSVNESLTLNAPAGNPIVSFISSNPTVFVAAPTGGESVSGLAVKAGTSTLNVQFVSGSPAVVVVTVS